MDYSINKLIHFNTDNGLLTLTGSEQSSVQLSRQSARLLSELIMHCGNTVSREDLLYRVWEEHTLTPSDGNLSNHISLLRKIFFQLGMKQNIIITVPKTGFRLEAEISIHHSHKKKSFLPQEITDTQLNTVGKKEKKKPGWIQKTGYFYPLIVLILIFLATLTFGLYNVSWISTNIGRCEIIDLEKNQGRYLAKELKPLTIFIEKNNIDCKKDKSIIYFKLTNTFPQQNDGGMRVIFLAQCSHRNDNRITHCANYWSATLTP